jgi:hypothetical protein
MGAGKRFAQQVGFREPLGNGCSPRWGTQLPGGTAHRRMGLLCRPRYPGQASGEVGVWESSRSKEGGSLPCP